MNNQVECAASSQAPSTATSNNKGWRSLDLTPNHSVVTVNHALSPGQVLHTGQESFGASNTATASTQFRTQRSSSVPVQQNQTQVQSQQQVDSDSTSKVRHRLQHFSQI